MERTDEIVAGNLVFNTGRPLDRTTDEKHVYLGPSYIG